MWAILCFLMCISGLCVLLTLNLKKRSDSSKLVRRNVNLGLSLFSNCGQCAYVFVISSNVFPLLVYLQVFLSHIHKN